MTANILAVGSILVAASLSGAYAVDSSSEEILARRMTAAEWLEKKEEVALLTGIRCLQTETRVVNCDLASELKTWAFTSAGHPAHPAYVERTMYFRNGILGLDVVGGYAGNRDAALDWVLSTVKDDQKRLESALAHSSSRSE